MKRDQKSKPAPRTSPAHDHRRVVVQHGDEASVNTKPADRRKTILLKNNGETGTGAGGPAGGSAPGSSGPPTTGPTAEDDTSSW
jgi:hypothetical protein